MHHHEVTNITEHERELRMSKFLLNGSKIYYTDKERRAKAKKRVSSRSNPVSMSMLT